MNRKVLSLFVAAVMLLSVVPVFMPYTAATSTSNSQARVVSTPNGPLTLQELNPNVAKYLGILHGTLTASNKKEVRLIMAPQRGYSALVIKELKNLGARIAPISKPKYDFIVATLPVDKLPLLKSMKGLAYVWEDRTIKLPKPMKPEAYPKAPINTLTSTGAGGYNPFDWDMYSIDAPQAREEYNVTGAGAVVAVIDTGADVAQPYLQQTPDGRRKIIYWLDETGEGNAYLKYTFNSSKVVNGTVDIVLNNVTIDWGPYATLVMRPSEYTTLNEVNVTIDFGDVNVTNGTYRFGFLPERYFDINFDHNYDEVYLVLVDPNNDTYFYPVPLQLNLTPANTQVAIIFQNGTPVELNGTLLMKMMTVPNGGNYTYDVNLSRAKQARSFDRTGAYLLLGPGSVNNPYYVTFMEGSASPTELANGTIYNSVVFCGLNGNTAVFGWDGGQHGTHVSGTIAGYGLPGTYFAGLEGVAPGAQLMEFKSLSSIGYGQDSWIIYGMIDATLKGANVISMSLGGLWSGYNDGLESPENYYADLLTERFGVTFVVAAGNSGPSTTTVGSPGDADFVITVGALRNGTSWSFFYGLKDVYTGPASFSSRGPRLDGMVKPDVMAPGEFVFSSLPIWSLGYYGTWASDFWDGTSMATPHVSGAAALLISYAKAHNLTYDPFMIKRALELSANPMSGALPIDQGYGLINVDKAIQELIKLSKEKTTYIYAGTTFAPYQNALGEKELPLVANILFDGWFQLAHNLPYLYRGVYLRNERPVAVPIYIYGMDYNRASGDLNLVSGTYRIFTSEPWLMVNKKAVHAAIGMGESGFYTTTGLVYVTIDYSKLQKPGTYVGYVYIDDPSTSYIDGAVPVIVTVPINKNDAPTGHLSDTELSGQAKHYYVDVPAGTKLLKITMSVPVDENGVPMGRVRPVIATPRGIVKYIGVPGYYFVGAGTPYLNYTWEIPNPQPGTWEVTAYSSVSSYARTGYELSHYSIDVQLEGVTVTPERIYKDVNGPGNYTVSATYTNTMSSVNVTPFGYGLGRLDRAIGFLETINQGQWKIVDIINATSGRKVYYLRTGITAPENKSADLDLYVLYYSTWNALMADLNSGVLGRNATRIYTNQIGPTSYESFEKFMPAPGYYLTVVHGYYVPVANMSYIYYHQILSDNGQITPETSNFTLPLGSSASIDYNVNLPDDGTYLGVVGLNDADTGIALSYSPVIMQAGLPETYVALMGSLVMGKASLMTLKILDAATMMPIHGEATVYINGRQYVAENGELQFYYTPTNSEVEFHVKVVTPYYKDYEGTFVKKVAEPFHQPITSTKQMSINIVKGNAEVVSSSIKWGQVSLTVNGTHGTNATMMIILPEDSKVNSVVVVPRDHLISWYTVKKTYAVYLFVTVKFASPVSIKVDFAIPQIPLSTLNYIGYRYYNMYSQQFEKLYSEAFKLGVNDTILEQAKSLNETAAQYYQKALDLAGGNIIIHLGDPSLIMPLRQAYVHELKAVRLLQGAIEDMQKEG
ncbi:S8 family serine peptidase [Thermococcus sp.]|uniref:S8 family serine peptidase n=1 Tax=Thermococcus sp. TaxID=35749 RepID=UPI0026105F5D|nr:S8 family serine peptidase [Thermococcus sp.]